MESEIIEEPQKEECIRNAERRMYQKCKMRRKLSWASFSLTVTRQSASCLLDE